MGWTRNRPLFVVQIRQLPVYYKYDTYKIKSHWSIKYSNHSICCICHYVYVICLTRILSILPVNNLYVTVLCSVFYWMICVVVWYMLFYITIYYISYDTNLLCTNILYQMTFYLISGIYSPISFRRPMCFTDNHTTVLVLTKQSWSVCLQWYIYIYIYIYINDSHNEDTSFLFTLFSHLK